MGRPKSNSKPQVKTPTGPWRDAIKPHPACEMLPGLSSGELKALGEDIKKHGLQVPVVIRADLIEPGNRASGYKYSLLDGRSRLDAMEAVGIDVRLTKIRKKESQAWRLDSDNGDVELRAMFPIIHTSGDGDPFDFVISTNLHRRHLTAEKKRDLIAKLLKANPERSDRAVGKMIGADGKTVASVRAEEEGRAEIPHVETRTDTKGRRQAAKPKRKPRKPKITKAATKAAEPLSEEALRKHAELMIENGTPAFDDAAARRLIAEVRQELAQEAAEQQGGSQTEPAPPPVPPAAEPSAVPRESTDPASAPTGPAPTALSAALEIIIEAAAGAKVEGISGLDDRGAEILTALREAVRRNSSITSASVFGLAAVLTAVAGYLEDDECLVEDDGCRERQEAEECERQAAAAAAAAAGEAGDGDSKPADGFPDLPLELDRRGTHLPEPLKE
jgi:hypothetical protein